MKPYTFLFIVTTIALALLSSKSFACEYETVCNFEGCNIQYVCNPVERPPRDSMPLGPVGTIESYPEPRQKTPTGNTYSNCVTGYVNGQLRNVCQ